MVVVQETVPLIIIFTKVKHQRDLSLEVMLRDRYRPLHDLMLQLVTMSFRTGWFNKNCGDLGNLQFGTVHVVARLICRKL